MICTSCGVHIEEPSAIYKCRQCVSHFVCRPCTMKEHNRASHSYHTLDKLNTTVKSVAPETSSLRTKEKTVGVEHNQQVRPTSIFGSKEYLTMILGYCNHCFKVQVCGKDVTFNCDQCPNDFAVCNKCISLMPNQHPSMHTFSKEILQTELLQRIHDLQHLGIICDKCKREKFDGIRHHCEQCESSYDLCEKCIGTTHNHHTFKIIPNPFIRANNNSMLAKRTLDVIARNIGAQNPQWRDPLTGWTKTDAENTIKQAQKEQEAYNAQLQKIQERELAAAKQILEQQREMARMQRDHNNFMLSMLSDNVLYVPRY